MTTTTTTTTTAAATVVDSEAQHRIAQQESTRARFSLARSWTDRENFYPVARLQELTTIGEHAGP